MGLNEVLQRNRNELEIKMGNSSALNSVMDQADQAAEDFKAPALASAQQSNLQTYQPAARPSLDDMADNAGMQVDAYLSVKETGLRIDKNPVFQKAKVQIDISKVIPITSYRANRGGQTTFIKSYDNVSTSTGQNLQAAAQQLAATHDKVDGPYSTVEIPALLLEDVPGAEKGKTLGITPAITGVKFWLKFYNELRASNLQRETVDVEIECVPQTNKNGNEWGVVGFNLIGKSK